MTIQNLGPCDWWATRDEEGYREYHIVFKVQSTDPYRWTGAAYAGDGPEAISGASGLPAIGDPWVYGNDSDVWAVCQPNLNIRPFGQKEGEAIAVWKIEFTFSNKSWCATNTFDNPLLEPQKVRGSSARYTIEAFKDRYGNPIMTSSHEPIRGPQVEFDGGRDQVVIEQNVSTLELGLCTSMRNKVNDDVLWGIAARRIKLSDFAWEELWYGTCTYYYKRTFTFDIRNNSDDLWDRDLLDEGTKVLSGQWVNGVWTLRNIGGSTPDKNNPKHFIRYKDVNDENVRVILDGKGMPADSVVSLGTGTNVAGTGTDSTDSAGQIHVEYYNEADFTVLGIPTTIDYGT
jgi:hypothetical protein